MIEVLHTRILSFCAPGTFVLDLGAGMGTYHEALIRRGPLLCVDAFAPYLQQSVVPVNAQVNADVREWLPQQRGDSFDYVLGIDFIEHLTRQDAEDVIANARRVARCGVALFVPEGLHPQTEDVTGLGGHHWQTHRSTWCAGDLRSLGFTTEIWPTFHAGTPGKDAGAIWATYLR